MSFSDAEISTRVRDAIKRIAQNVLKEEGVTYRYGTVTAIDYDNQLVTVQFPGGATGMPVKTLGVQPTAVGQVVQVAGRRGDHFVTGVVGASSLVAVQPSTLGTPTLSLSATVGAVVANWTTVTNAASYEIEFAEDSGFTTNPSTYQIAGDTLTYYESNDTKSIYARVRALTPTDPPQAGSWSTTAGPTSPDPVTVDPTDGNVPADSPDVTVTSGLGYLFASWPAQSNADPVTYEVHVSTSSGFTPGPTTLYDEVTGLTSFIETDASGTPLAYDTTYYIRILAKDGDGPAATAGAQDSAQVSRVETGDAGSIGIGNISDGSVPSTSPDVGSITSGVGFLYVSWDHVTNTDPVTYEVHISTTSGFSPDANTRVGDTPSNYYFIRKQGPGAGGAPLAHATTYYVKLIAYDVDGYAAAYGAQGSGSIIKVGTVDIEDAAVDEDQIASSAVTTAKIAADAVTAGELADNAVGTEHVQALAITAAELDNLAVTTAKIAADAVTAGEIAAGAVEYAALESGLEPVRTVSTLPTLPDANYPTGAVVMLTTDGKLYRNNSGTWDASVPTTDLTGQITETQITDDAVTTDKIAANAVTASEIAANTITASEIAADTITAGQIAAGTITTDEIAANTIQAGDIAANTITASEIAAGTITAAEIEAGTITASEIATGTITALQIAAGTITSDEIAANTIQAGDIAANTITAAEIAAGAIDTDELAAGAVTTAKLDALAVTADKIAANTITAGQIAANTITAGQIAADTITADLMAANSITAANAAIADLAVETAKIAGLAVTEAKIASAAISEAKIQNLAVTNAKINDLEVSKVTSGSLSADVIVSTGEVSVLGADGEVLIDDFGVRLYDNTTRTDPPRVYLKAADGSASFVGQVSIIEPEAEQYINLALPAQGAEAHPYSNISYDGLSELQANTASSLWISSDGKHIFAANYYNSSTGRGRRIGQWTLDTSFDVEPHTFVGWHSTGLSAYINPSITFKPDGTRMFWIGNGGDTVYVANLSTAWDITTAVNDTDLYGTFTESYASGLEISENGQYLFLSDLTDDEVNRYTLSTPWDPSTMGSKTTYDISATLVEPQEIRFSADGTVCIIDSSSTNDLYKFEPATAWTVSNHTDTLDTSSWLGAANLWSFAIDRANGTCFFMCKTVGYDIEQFNFAFKEPYVFVDDEMRDFTDVGGTDVWQDGDHFDDGTETTYTSFLNGSGAGNGEMGTNYLEIDLGQERDIAEIKTYWLAPEERSHWYKIGYSFDNRLWYYAKGSPGTAGWVSSRLDPRLDPTTDDGATVDQFNPRFSARFLRIYGDGNTTDATNKLLEVEIYSTYTVKDLLTIGKNFSVNADGDLYAADATIVGEVTATNLGYGVLGYAQATTAQTNIASGSSVVDLTNLSVTVTLQANRRIRVSAVVQIGSYTAGNLIAAWVREGTTKFGRVAVLDAQEAAQWEHAHGAVIIDGPSAGSHTYKLSIETVTGTGNSRTSANSDRPNWIMVEDLGPSS